VGAHKRSLNLAATFVAATLLAAAPASGQHFHGVLRDGTSGEPVPGAVVWLADSADRFLARSVSRDSGAFELLRFTGSARIHVLRIGYRPKTMPISMNAADSIVVVNLTPIPLQLAAVESRGRRVCPGDIVDSTGLELWNQARSALMATIIAREANPPSITLYSYVQTLEPVAHRLIDDSSDTKQVSASKSYVAARPARAFASEGYVRDEVGGDRTYFAPDEEVMFDSSFVETHCLHAITGEKAHGGQVGVGFEPIYDHGRDTLVDIQGVLWMDIEHPRLLRLEFTYTGLEPAAEGSGGDIQFGLTPDGTTMIERWQIRATVLVNDEPQIRNGLSHRPRPRRERRQTRVVKYLRIGGQLVSVSSTGPNARAPHIAGQVVDAHQQPVAGARVWLRNSADTVTADADGRFVIPHVPAVSPLLRPGVQVVMASDSVLARAGVPRSLPRVVFVPAYVGLDSVRVVLEPRAMVLPMVCPTRSYRPGTGVILAKVMTPESRGVDDANVSVILDSTTIPTVRRAETHEGKTDARGNSAICGAPLGRPLHIRASRDGRRGELAIPTWTDEVMVVQIVIIPQI
jgi:hypothetical protein